MPGIVRTEIDEGDGGGSCTPTPYGTGSPNVFANGFNVIRVGDPLVSGGHADEGSSNVFVNGISVHRLGDRTECGGQARTSSSNVIAN